MQKRLIVVGCREHVFHYLPEVKFFPTWEQAMDQLREEALGQEWASKSCSSNMPHAGVSCE